MAREEQWNFDCPQYVDFLAGIDSESDDKYFDCAENFSPLEGRACKNIPAYAKTLTGATKIKLDDEIIAALPLTPKLKTGSIRGKLFSEKGPVKNVGVQPVKPFLKPSTLYRSSARERSKSVYEVNKVHTHKSVKVKEFRPKRSSSLNDLRAIKKHTYPRTPLCLKRTINAKNKVWKTSEELELEQIAELQKKMAQLLRNNEISYKRLKLRQKPCIQKNTENKPENPKGNAISSTHENIRRNFHMLNCTAMKQEAMKLNAIVNKKLSSFKTPKSIYKDNLERSKNPSVSSSIVSEESDKSKDQASKNHLNVKYRFPSVSAFHDNVKKCSVVKPFNFEAKVKEMRAQNAHRDQKAEVSHTKSVSKDYISNGKENIPLTKSNSAVKKIISVQNTDIKLAGLNKIIGQRNGDPVKGLPLAGNTARN